LRKSGRRSPLQPASFAAALLPGGGLDSTRFQGPGWRSGRGGHRPAGRIDLRVADLLAHLGPVPVGGTQSLACPHCARIAGWPLNKSMKQCRRLLHQISATFLSVLPTPTSRQPLAAPARQGKSVLLPVAVPAACLPDQDHPCRDVTAVCRSSRRCRLRVRAPVAAHALECSLKTTDRPRSHLAGQDLVFRTPSSPNRPRDRRGSRPPTHHRKSGKAAPRTRLT